MDIEKLKLEAQNKALHIADVSGSIFFGEDSKQDKNYKNNIRKSSSAHRADILSLMYQIFLA